MELELLMLKQKMEYQLAGLPLNLITLPFPNSGSQSQEEFLDTYN